MKRKAPAVCPVCGEDVPPQALACPECGACHETGWREDAGDYAGLDLPDEAWHEEDTKKPLRRRESRSGLSPFWRSGVYELTRGSFAESYRLQSAVEPLLSTNSPLKRVMSMLCGSVLCGSMLAVGGSFSPSVEKNSVGW